MAPQEMPVPQPGSSASLPATSDSAPLVSAPAVKRDRVSTAIDRTRDWLMSQQHEDGYWCAELEGDSILQSEYILLMAWLKREHEPACRQASEYLLLQQEPHGGWAQYPGGPLEISGSVKAYFALKLTGHNAQASYMQRARRAICKAGGADAVNSFTRFYLALLGQISYDHCPAVPPELALLPKWLPVNLYRMSSWSRTIVVPLSLMWAHRPAREIDPARGIEELFLAEPENWPPLSAPGEKRGAAAQWASLFRTLDRVIKWCDRRRLRPLRGAGIRAAQQWMLDRFAGSDGLGAIFPPIIWSIVALECLGYDDKSPELRYCHEQLEDLMIRQRLPRREGGVHEQSTVSIEKLAEQEEDNEGETVDTLRLQPCKSPVWDTAISLRALAAAGGLEDSALRRGIRWLLSKEVTRKGDWAVRVDAEPGGWFFEHHNEFYPDVDDTAMALMALREQFGDVEISRTSGGILTEGLASRATSKALEDSSVVRWKEDSQIIAAAKAASLLGARKKVALLDRVATACERARLWMMAMQNRDGGWGAFDKDNDAEFLCHVPFADHNAMIDPSTPDITGRVLESLGSWGIGLGEPEIDMAVEYLRKTQERDGSWYGRWGVNYIYGTWQVLAGLAAVGVPVEDRALRRGASWLTRYELPGGGWGESPRTYDQPELRGGGPATASQTAWAVLGLMAAGQLENPATQRGIEWLLKTQKADGTWDEPEFTGTGFPRVFYLRYHYYPIYFPLLALAEWRRHGAVAGKVG